jgi:predicted ATPase/signal transduction histidine kinase
MAAIALQLEGYELGEELHYGPRTWVHRATRIADGLSVVLKTSSNHQPTQHEVMRLRTEFEIGRRLKHPHLISFLDLVQSADRPVIVMEDAGERSLAELLAGAPLDTDTFLSIAIQMADGLSALHQEGVVHKDVNPTNVIHSMAAGGQSKLIDLSIASVMQDERLRISRPDQIEGTLRYISPEQTGRMNRSLDYRTDMYSLGVTFYEMLSGVPPFATEDPVELVYAHMAQSVPPLSQTHAEIPPALGAIVGKLLAKTAEDRYQTAAAVAADLRYCQEKLRTQLSLGDFKAGLNDISPQLRISERLYGRSRERDELLSVFHRVAHGGRELLLLNGEAGVGKSALAAELYQPVLKKRGWYISGTFDESRRDIPYSAFLQCMGELIQRLLTQSQPEIDRWRSRIAEALGGDCGVLVEALPDLEELVGATQDMPMLAPKAAERRFHDAMSRFFRVFGADATPLVIQLDDLHDADTASLHLLEVLLGDDELHGLLVIGCYQSSQIGSTHALALTLREIRQLSAEVTELKVKPLETGHIARMLADSLQTHRSETQELAQTIHQKTLGNPGFLRQFLHSLHRASVLRFDTARFRWLWDIGAVKKHAITDNVVPLLLEKMALLPEQSRKVLQTASCVGQRFNLETLAQLAGRTPCAMVEPIHQAVKEGILRPIGSCFGKIVAGSGIGELSEICRALNAELEFAHDQFRQTAYDGIAVEDRPSLHLRLARLLHHELNDKSRDERLFEIVRHFEIGKRGLRDSDERLAVAQLNHRAGLRAEGSAALDAAATHFDTALELLPERAWSTNYDICFDLHHRLSVSLSGLRRDPERVLALTASMTQRSRTLAHRLKGAAPRVTELARSGSPEEALTTAFSVLREFGIDLDTDDPEEAWQERARRIDELVGDRPIKELRSYRQADDEAVTAALELMRGTFLPLFMKRRELVTLAMAEVVRVSLEKGLAPMSGMAFSTWGRMVAHSRGDYAAGAAYAHLGIAVAEDSDTHRCGAQMVAYGGTLWLTENLREVLDGLRRTFRIGVERGEAFYAGLTAANLSSMAFAFGEPLEQLYEENRGLARYIETNMGDLGVREIHLTQRAIEVLRGQRPQDDTLFDGEDNVDAVLGKMAGKNAEAVIWYHLIRSRIAYLFGDFAAAANAIERTTPHVDASMTEFALIDVHFYGALAVSRGRDEEYALTAIEEHRKHLESIVDAGGGINFQHKLLLIKGEQARLNGESERAASAYEDAIRMAGEGGFLADQALANEVAARHYLDRKLEKVAAVYLADARYGYEKWGATSKIEQLDEDFASILHPRSRRLNYTRELEAASGVKTTSSSEASLLDMGTVIKASHALAGEVVADTLLRKLLGIVAENVGAQRAFLILPREDDFIIAGNLEDGHCSCHNLELAVEGSDHLSRAIVHYTARTKKRVVLADASSKGPFRSDPYVETHAPKSVLSLPLTSQGELVAVLYLENNLATDVFTSRHVEVAELIGSQAAISIVNARLYQELQKSNDRLAQYSQTLERKVDERTTDLAQKNAQLNESLARQERMQDQLLISEKMASLGNLVAGVAHEINTPIGAVISSVDVCRRVDGRLDGLLAGLLAENSEAEKKVHRLQKMMKDNHDLIHTAGERIGEVVGNLRNFARLDEAERQKANLHDGIESTIKLTRHRFKGHVDVELQFGEIPSIVCYPNQLNQVFMNLIVNAVDAIEEKRIRDSAFKRGIIRIETNPVNGMAQIRFSDNGVGMAPEQSKRIFEPGFTTKGVGVGTGLGLSISYNIIHQHGGTIDVSSEVGTGTIFEITLPLETANRNG